jgi:Transposase and inactivated derivatives
VKTPEELLREFANNPAGLAEYAAQLQQQLAQAREQQAQTQEQLVLQAQQLAQAQREMALQGQQLAQAQAIIAELKRELFGAKADKLNEEQEEQLRQLLGDAQEQNQRPPPLSQEVLEEAVAQERAEQRQRAKERTRRHLPPVELEKRQTILEPDDRICPTSGQERKRIGQEVTTEYDYLPAKLIIHEIVRPKYGSCEKPCCQGVTIAALPPRLVPQSKLGLGLAVYLLLSRFDDHVAYYTLERIFRERFGAMIPRQQMVQWVEKVAHLLLADLPAHLGRA